MRDGHFTEMADVFDHSFWDVIREKVAKKALDIHEQKFFGNAMLDMDELKYGGVIEKIKELDKRFKIKKDK